MQQTSGVAVLTTHLAHTDRRALSEAWYRALHVAERAPRRGSAVRAVSPPAGEAGCRIRVRRSPADAVPGARGIAVRAVRAGSGQPGAAGAAGERRAPATRLARRLERTLHARTPRRGIASFALRAAHGRVHVAVRSDGASTRVVVICAPALRERVERALAHARFVLAAQRVRPEVTA